MQAVDESVSKNIRVTPNELGKGENIEFQVTSTRGVSFPKDDRTPTIVVKFDKPAQVQAVTIPRDKTPSANVQQFEVTFYSPDGKKIKEKPTLTNSSPKDEKKNPARLDSTQTPSNTPVSRLEITVVKTTDGESPKGVVLDIQACTEGTTGEYCRGEVWVRCRRVSLRHCRYNSCTGDRCDNCTSVRSHDASVRNTDETSVGSHDPSVRSNDASIRNTHETSVGNHDPSVRNNDETMCRNASC